MLQAGALKLNELADGIQACSNNKLGMISRISCEPLNGALLNPTSN